MPEKVSLAIEDLSYCGGCDVALADMGSVLLNLFAQEIDLRYAPLFMSAKDYHDVDLVLVTGAVRTEEDLERLQHARQHAGHVATFGSCACFGGLPELANLSSQEQLLAGYTVSTEGPDQPYKLALQKVPALLESIQPVDDYVKVDFMLPGCPPPPALIAVFLKEVLKEVRSKVKA